MKKIEVYIWNGENIDKNDLLGTKEPDMYLTDLCFSETAIDAFYVQKHVDSETKTRNIVIVVSGTTYCTPYSEEKQKLLKSCLI